MSIEQIKSRWSPRTTVVAALFLTLTGGAIAGCVATRAGPGSAPTGFDVPGDKSPQTIAAGREIFRFNGGVANSLLAKLDAAENQFRRGNVATAVNQLGAFVNELDALIRSGRLSGADAAQLRALVTRIMAAAS